MDVYLSHEAWQHLRAQALEIPHRRAGGLLLGHRRGRRFHVERVHPCYFGKFPTSRDFLELNRIFEGKIIGFYSSVRASETKAGKFPPFSYNKLFLEFDLHPKKGLMLRPAVVEYSDSFYLVPAVLTRRPKRRP